MPTRNSSTFGGNGPAPTVVFGTSRKHMKKLYVDAIIESSKKPETSSPGAGKYHMAYDWVPRDDFSKTKVTAKWSMGRRLNHFDKHLQKAGALPGPSDYGTDDMRSFGRKEAMLQTFMSD